MARLLVSLVNEDFGNPVYAFKDGHRFGAMESTYRYKEEFGSMYGYQPKFLIIDAPDVTPDDAKIFFIENDGFVTDIRKLIEDMNIDVSVNNETVLFGQSLLKYISTEDL